MTGYKRSELARSSIELLVPAELRSFHVRHRREYRAGRADHRPMGSSDRDFRVRRKDGSKVFADIALGSVNTKDGYQILRSLKTFPLLDGYRGAPKADVEALEDVLLRVSARVEDHSEIAEMDLNPLVVHSVGAVAVDARIRLETGLERKPLGPR